METAMLLIDNTQMSWIYIYMKRKTIWVVRNKYPLLLRCIVPRSLYSRPRIYSYHEKKYFAQHCHIIITKMRSRCRQAVRHRIPSFTGQSGVRGIGGADSGTSTQRRASRANRRRANTVELVSTIAISALCYSTTTGNQGKYRLYRSPTTK